MGNHRSAWLVAAALVVSLCMIGCQYPISREYRLQARQDLTVPLVQADPEACKGDTVIWGGKVIQTVNRPDGTELTVLASPLDAGEDPLSDAYSEGRFIARTSQFLDPEVYARGRRVTLAGQITGTEARPLGGTQYAYPVVEIKQITVWPREMYYYDGGYYPGYYYGPYGWPYYWWDPWFGGPFVGGLFFDGREEHEGHEGGHGRR